NSHIKLQKKWQWSGLSESNQLLHVPDDVPFNRSLYPDISGGKSALNRPKLKRHSPQNERNLSGGRDYQSCTGLNYCPDLTYKQGL
ncbi:MAG: hypothetical protein NC340_05075, partial [Ruminococcus flavefaciens]|nr:hypothetical protein [Ruminococcus flavefaciens]